MTFLLDEAEREAELAFPSPLSVAVDVQTVTYSEAHTKLEPS